VHFALKELNGEVTHPSTIGSVEKKVYGVLHAAARQDLRET
jgi:hypothetical protein